jgi:hypothetical protein
MPLIIEMERCVVVIKPHIYKDLGSPFTHVERGSL